MKMLRWLLLIIAIVIMIIGIQLREAEIVNAYDDYKSLVIIEELKETQWQDFGISCSDGPDGAVTNPLEASKSQLETLVAMRDDMLMVDFAYRKIPYYKIQKLKKYSTGERIFEGTEADYIKLQKLLELFNVIDNSSMSRQQKLEKMYNLFLTNIPEMIETENALQIQELLRTGGDCNDISPALFAILNYFHFETYVQWGKLCYGEKRSVGKIAELPSAHAWIVVKINGRTLTLDPTWYNEEYVELPKRGNLEVQNLAKRYMRYK